MRGLRYRRKAHLQLDLGLGDVLLASVAVGNLLGLGDLGSDGVGAEVLEGVALDGVDAHGGAGLDGRESTRHCNSTCQLRCCFEGNDNIPFGRPGGERTEELLGAAALLDDLDDAGLELLDRGNVVGEDTHLTGLGGDVDLDDVLGLVDGLYSAMR